MISERLVPHQRSDTPAVLAVTSEIPWPLDSGGHQRTFFLLRALASRFRLRLVVPATSDAAPAIEKLRQHGIGVRPVFVRKRSRLREFLRAGIAALRAEPYVCYRRHDWRAVRRAIHCELQEHPPDLLYLDHLDSMLYRPKAFEIPAVLDLHNVYSTLVQRAAAERGRLSRVYLLREARMLQRMEWYAISQADTVFSVSTADAEFFRSLGGRNIEVVPNGVDCAAHADLPCGRNMSPPLILYVGAMSWAPNVSAARFLAIDVLPRIQQRYPAARLRIVGRDPGAQVLALGRLPGVEVTGTVVSMEPHLAQARLLAVPLESGGGTRLKILEAFAAGLPVVSTSVGCEGLNVTHGDHLLIAERDQFADAVLALISDTEGALRRTKRARVLANEEYDWAAIGKRACRIADIALRRGADRGSRLPAAVL